MNKSELIAKLREGYELANRGTGWWLSTKKVAYRGQDSVKVDDDLMRELESEGIFKIVMLTTSMRAELVDASAGNTH